MSIDFEKLFTRARLAWLAAMLLFGAITAAITFFVAEGAARGRSSAQLEDHEKRIVLGEIRDIQTADHEKRITVIESDKKEEGKVLSNLSSEVGRLKGTVDTLNQLIGELIKERSK